MQEEYLNQQPSDFDEYWRKVDLEQGPAIAAQMVVTYISKNKEWILHPKEGEKSKSISKMYFHAGQLFAACGKDSYTQAIDMFQQSFKDNAESWNAYVSATIGFLEQDKDKINQAIQSIELSSETDRREGNIEIVRRFLKALEEGNTDYNSVYN